MANSEYAKHVICTVCGRTYYRIYHGIERGYGLCECNGELVLTKRVEEKKLEKARDEVDKLYGDL